MEFYSGDLIETITYKGQIVYGVVLESVVRFHYTELRIWSRSKIISIVHDGNKGGVKLIQRDNNEERITRKAI